MLESQSSAVASELRSKVHSLDLRACLLDEVEYFDNGYFKISEAEALAMDPQQRLIMQVTAEALMDAGIEESAIRKRKVGVFVGLSNVDYPKLLKESDIDMYSLTGSSPSIAANRLSYFYDWHGPSLTVDTACSSSLTAVHLARQSIEAGECEMAVVAAANLILTAHVDIGYQRAQANSPTFSCKAFDEKADGVIRGEGVASILLMPLEMAKKINGRAYAIIKASAVLQDGLSNGLTAPNPMGQARTIKEALINSHIETTDIDFIETHGTGTPLGDPIEARALSEVFTKDRNDFLKIGSVKTNIGHTEAAAGLAGLIKTALCLYHRNWVGNANFVSASSRIPFSDYRIKVQGKNTPIAGIVKAGVSSFGFGGTNAHVILETAPQFQSKHEERSQHDYYLLKIAADSEYSAKEFGKHLHSVFLHEDRQKWPAIIQTFEKLKKKGRYRLGLVLENHQALEKEQDVFSNRKLEIARPQKVVFVYSGMGSQYVGMGRQLYGHGIFKNFFDECAQTFLSLGASDIRPFLVDQDLQVEVDPVSTQLLIFSIQVATTELLKSVNVTPSAVIGSSVGEIAAAYAAGKLTIPQCCKLVYERILLLKSQVGTGTLCVAMISPEEAAKLERAGVWAVAHNSPSQVVFAVSKEHKDEFQTKLKTLAIPFKPIPGGQAPSHTPLLEPLKEEFENKVPAFTSSKSEIAFYSTVTMEKTEILDRAYWWKNLTRRISFKETLEKVERDLTPVYIEISPSPLMIQHILETLLTVRKSDKINILPSLDKRDLTQRTFYQTLAKLYESGINVDSILANELDPNVLDILPKYPWEKKRFWPAHGTLLSSVEAKEAQDSLMARQLEAIPVTQRQTFFVQHLRQELARMMNLPEVEIKQDVPLTHLGVGSLVGMELYNKIKADLQVELPLTFFLKGPSLSEISLHVIEDFNLLHQKEKIEKVFQRESLELNRTQTQLLFLNEILEEKYTYHIPLYVTINGKFDSKIFAKALRQATDRHELLRTTYSRIAGKFSPVIHENVDPQYEHLEEFNSHLSIAEYFRNFARKEFKLSERAPFRVLSIKTSSGEYKLLFIIHHVIADGWALKILIRDLGLAYQGLLGPKPHKDFFDFTQSIQGKPHPFWMDTLENAPHYSGFISSQKRASERDHRGKRKVFLIQGSPLENLESDIKNKGLTLFQSLSALIGLILYRQSGMNDFVMGTPVAGRYEPGTEEVLGCLLKMLPIRMKLEGIETFADVVNYSKSVIQEALIHQNEQVPEFSPQVVLALHAPVEINTFAGMNIHAEDLDLGVSKFDVSFSFMRKKDGLECVLEWKTALYDESEISSWVATLEHLMVNFSTIHATSINMIPLKEIHHERSQIIYQPAFSILGRFQELSEKHPNRIFFEDGTSSFTYRDCWRKASTLAKGLQEKGLQSGSTVALDLPLGIDLISLQLASWLNGGNFVVLDPESPAQEKERVLRASQAAFAVSNETLATLTLHDTSFISHQNNFAETAYLIMTSGTTAEPKAVEVNHGAFLHLLEWHINIYPSLVPARVGLMARTTFDASLWEIWAGAMKGATLIAPASKARESLLAIREWVLSKQITDLFLSTSLFEALNKIDFRASQLEYIFTGGDKLGIWPSENWPCPVFNHYGPSECAVVTTSIQLDKEQENIPSLGTPIGLNKIKIVDPQGLEVPHGFLGEIKITGPSIGHGYRKNPEANSTRFPDQGRSYLTRDQGRINRFGHLEFHGRLDNQVKIRGYRIELDEIKTHLLNHPEITEAEVLSHGDLVAFISGKASEEDVKQYLAEKLIHYKIPQSIYKLPSLPLTPNGKVDRKKLLELQQQKCDDLPDVSSRISRIFKDILKTDRVSENANFLENGGNSILALQLVDQLETEFKVKIPLKMLYGQLKLRDIASFIDSNKHEEKASDLDRVTDHDPEFPLTDMQEAYWVGRQAHLFGGGVSPQLYIEIDATHLNISTFENALNQLIHIHPMLRAIVTPNGKQKILDADMRYTLEKRTISSQAELLNEREKASHHQFDPAVWPLFKVSVLEHNKAYILQLNIDGLIADAMSLKIMMNDLWLLYSGSAIKAPSYTYKEYVLAQKKRPTAMDEIYWSEFAEKMPAPPSLPITLLKAPHFKRWKGTLPQAQWNVLKSRLNEAGISPTAFIAGLFGEILSRWSEEKTFSLLLTLFNRKQIHPEINRIVGDFVSLLPLIFEKNNASTPFIEVAKKVSQQLLSHLDHRDLSGIWVLRNRQKLSGRGANESHMVLTSFIGENFDPHQTPFGKVTSSISQTPQVSIDHQVYETDGDLHFNWDCNVGRLSQELVDEIFTAYETTLRSAVANGQAALTYQACPPQWIKKPKEKSQLDSGLYSLFEESCKNYPDNIAIVTPDKGLSYKTLQREVNCFRASLLNVGMQKGDLVALQLDKTPKQIALVLAILANGGTFVPLSMDFPPMRIETIRKQANLKIIIDQETTLEELPPCDKPAENVRANDLAYVIYTSGTTGEPKGVMIEHGAVVPTILDVNDLINLKASDKILNISELSFDLSIYDLFGAFSVGATIALPEGIQPREIEKLTNFVQTKGVTIWNSVPTYFKLFAESSKYQQSSLTKVLLSGDWVPPELMRKSLQHMKETKFWSLGGATEASIWSIQHPITEVPKDAVSIPYGLPLEGQNVFILDSFLMPCEVNVAGDIYISGIGLSCGYLNQVEITKKSFIQWNGQTIYRTGDRGRTLANGVIEFLGRKDSQVKIQGFRIEVQEIEQHLKAILGVKDAFITVQGEMRGEKFLLAHAETKLNKNDLKEALEKVLPQWMVPKNFIIYESFPLTANGKVDRKAMGQIPSSVESQVGPMSSGNKNKIKRILSDVLKNENIGDDDDLIGQGANSVDMVVIGNHLKDTFGKAPELSEIFNLRTINLITAYYEKKTPTAAITPILDIEARAKFKSAQTSLRELDSSNEVKLIYAAETANSTASTRSFSTRAMELNEIASLLSVLKRQEGRTLYPSAGAIYPVQIYLHIKESKVNGLTAGTYYFHPIKGSLHRISEERLKKEELHFPPNFELYAQSAVSLLLVANLSAIAPLYGEKAKDYCLIEAGAMSELIRTKGAELNIGQCIVGHINEPRLLQEIKPDFEAHFMTGIELGPLDAWEEIDI